MDHNNLNVNVFRQENSSSIALWTHPARLETKNYTKPTNPSPLRPISGFTSSLKFTRDSVQHTVDATQTFRLIANEPCHTTTCVTFQTTSPPRRREYVRYKTIARNRASLVPFSTINQEKEARPIQATQVSQNNVSPYTYTQQRVLEGIRILYAPAESTSELTFSLFAL